MGKMDLIICDGLWLKWYKLNIYLVIIIALEAGGSISTRIRTHL